MAVLTEPATVIPLLSSIPVVGPAFFAQPAVAYVAVALAAGVWWWLQRTQGGLALRAIGAPGTLFLRRATKSDDRFAADMAHQVLDLPAAATG